MAGVVRQNYHEDCEAAINKHVNLQLHASYVFLSMGYYFDRDDVALPGLSKLFLESSDKELKAGHQLMEYQNQRGGRVVLQAIPPPPSQEWGPALDALKSALDLKKQINKSILELREVAGGHGDAHAEHFVDDNLMEGQVEELKHLGDLLTQLQRAGDTQLGLHMFDKQLL